MLAGSLKLRLGGSDALRVFFDSESLGVNQRLDQMLKAAERSAVFLAVASRSFAEREWTRQELGAFVRASNDTSRLFAIECLPLGEGEVYPAPLQDHHRMPFWRGIGGSNTPIPLSLTLDTVAFQQRVHDLAEQIRNVLVALRRSQSVEAAKPNASARISGYATAGSPSSGNTRKILLAQVTDDLEDEREELRRYLEQMGVTMVGSATYPQGGEAFAAAFAADLTQAELFVQLLSRQAGRAPPDLPEGYTRHQYQAAARSGLEILQWRRPDLDPAEVANLQQRTLLLGESVVATGFEGFKAEVLRRTTKVVATTKLSRSSLVFINADRDDADIAKTLQREFGLHKFATALPALEGAAEEVRADLEDNLIECDALILVYGQSTPVWVRGQLRLYNKLRARRSEPPKLLAVYTGPPASKPDLGFMLPDVREIDCRTEVAVEPLRAIIEELAR